MPLSLDRKLQKTFSVTVSMIKVIGKSIVSAGLQSSIAKFCSFDHLSLSFLRYMRIPLIQGEIIFILLVACNHFPEV